MGVSYLEILVSSMGPVTTINMPLLVQHGVYMKITEFPIPAHMQ